MVRLILFFAILSIPQCFGQTRIYEFDNIATRTNNDWVTVPNNGEVQFNDDNLFIITEQFAYEFIVKSKSYWINDSSIMLGCNDASGKSLTIRLLVDPKERMNTEKIELFIHFEHGELGYYKIMLNKCKYE
jgi:hypothetical protein